MPIYLPSRPLGPIPFHLPTDLACLIILYQPNSHLYNAYLLIWPNPPTFLSSNPSTGTSSWWSGSHMSHIFSEWSLLPTCLFGYPSGHCLSSISLSVYYHIFHWNQDWGITLAFSLLFVAIYRPLFLLTHTNFMFFWSSYHPQYSFPFPLIVIYWSSGHWSLFIHLYHSPSLWHPHRWPNQNLNS